jgi:hypothetical protein
MKNKKTLLPEGCIEVRHNLIYSITVFLFGFAFIVLPILFFSTTLRTLFIFLGVLMVFYGLGAIFGGRYVRYNPLKKELIFSTLYDNEYRTIKYDKLFFKGKSLYREINGKTKYIFLLRFQCNKQDLDILFQEINKG